MTTTPENNAVSRQPTHHAFHVREREGAKSIWTRIGSAWQHQDGKGFSLSLDATPVDGRLTLRLASESK